MAKDEQTQENILNEWKKKYTAKLIDSLQPKGDVLEIGFDQSFSADAIQKQAPKSHIIIEEDYQRFLSAKAWANDKTHVDIIRGNWKEELPKLKLFDAVFFNDYPFPDRDVSTLNFLFQENSKKTSEDAKQLIDDIQEEMSHLKVRFSDHDIDSFYQHIGRVNLKDLPVFFKKLKENGNISSSQYEMAIKKYHLHNIQSKESSSLQNEKSQMIACLEECLKNHMKVGSRFSSFLIKQTSNYDDSVFFDKIITNPLIDYREETVQIELSDKPREAFIMLVQKNFTERL